MVQQVKLDIPNKDGVTPRDHYIIRGQDAPEPNFHPSALYLWEIFWRLRNTGGSYEVPISFVDIHAWMQVTGNSLLPWECDIILNMDIAYRQEVSEIIRKKNKG